MRHRFSTQYRAFRRFPALLLLAAALAGCDGGGVGGDFSPSFTATVAGATTDELRGVAAFGFQQNGDTGQIRFVIELQSDRENPYTLITLNRPYGSDTAIRAAGTYRFGDATAPASQRMGGGDVIRMQNDTVVADLDVVSGVLQVDAVEQDRLRGHFSVTARGYLVIDNTAHQNAEITITGSFDAARGR